MSHEHIAPNLLDPFEGRLSLHLVGSFRRGGTLRVEMDGRVTDFITLPRKQWAALAVLVQSVLESTALGSFLDSDRLATVLAKREVISLNDPPVAIRIVYRLRKTLNKLSAARLLLADPVDRPPDFATQLIPTWRALGYRLSLPAARVSLEVPENE